MSSTSKFFLSLLIVFSSSLSSYSALIRFKGNWSDEKYSPNLSVQEHYDQGVQAYHAGKWEEAYLDLMVIVYNFPTSPFHGDAIYYAGLCQLNQGNFSEANKLFDLYLDGQGALKHFEDIFDRKYEIANSFASGTKRHLFGGSGMPKIASGKNSALQIYDEIIASMPTKEIAADALYQKAKLLRKRKDFREAIDSLQSLARRYPKHPLAAKGYLLIGKIYLQQGKLEAQNPDLLSLSQINLAHFNKAFPGDERITKAEADVLEMKEICAKSLYNTGRFYEKKRKSHASTIYYRDALRKYPGTSAAFKSQERLDKIEKKR